jgi:tellurium resistance protein TerD
MSLSNINQSDEKIRCPNCSSTQVFADKKGYSGIKACCGYLLVGPLGLLCGTHKSNNIRVTCLKCKHSW